MKFLNKIFGSGSAPKTRMPKATGVTKRRKLRRTITRPAVGSLYDILHDHAGVALFHRPLHWTDLHTQLLGHFVELPPHDTPMPTPTSSEWPLSASPSPQYDPWIPPTVISISQNLAVLTSPSHPISLSDTTAKDAAMLNMMSTFYPASFGDTIEYAELDMLFGPCFYPCAVSCQLLWYPARATTNTASFNSATTWAASQPASPGVTPFNSMVMDMPYSSPILAYVSRSHLEYVRKNCFRILKGPKGVFNSAVVQLHARRAKILQPKNVDEDAYFLGIMMAMAQQSAYVNLRNASGFTPKDVKVRLLTVAEEDEAFIVYTGTVPGALLSMLHKPSAAPTGNPEIKVEYTRVPVWPVLGLKERLGKALGSDVVGDFDDALMDTYENEPLGSFYEPAPCSRKRGREALSEVFNGSFCEDSDTSCASPTPPPAKKQCVEEAVARIGGESRRRSLALKM
ncbi:hypothetical protein NUW58_g7708 [Xylaria curta]|uniref:Uncharacterized protein n=1 Tax=Xylaria curta TaxID=42375 RepID=A0ACC1NFC5_9PEZI|nr:hypothetical protein NUW58_g7708 [Xylaria curta]